MTTTSQMMDVRVLGGGFGCALLTILACSAGAEDRMERPGFEVGRAYVLRTKQRLDSSGVAGREQRSQLEMQVEVFCRRSRGEGSGQELEVVVEWLAAQMELAGERLVYDSRRSGEDRKPGPLDATMSELLETPFRVVLNEGGEVSGVEGLESFAKANHPLGARFDEGTLGKLLVPAMGLGVPEEGVMEGDRWKHELDLDLGPAGELGVELDMRHAGGEEEGDRLIFEGKVKGKAATAGGPGDPVLPLRVEPGKAKGSALVNRRAGFVKRMEFEAEFAMSVPDPVRPGQTLRFPMRYRSELELVDVRRRLLRR